MGSTASTLGIQNKAGIMIIDRVDANGTATATKAEVISFAGTSSSTVTTLVRGLAGTTAQDHAVGAIVEFGPDCLQQQEICDLLDGTDSGATLKTPVIASFYQDAGLTKLMTIPNTASDTLVGKATTDTLTNKTLTSPVINTSVSGTAILDEDDMASDSATKVPTQQSVKAYVAASVGVLSSKIITFTRDMAAANGDVDYAVTDFIPSSLIGIAAIDGAFTFSIGMADSSKAVSQMESTSATAMEQLNTALFTIVVSAGNFQSAIVKTYGTTLTLTWTKTGSPTGTAKIAIICFR